MYTELNIYLCTVCKKNKKLNSILSSILEQWESIRLCIIILYKCCETHKKYLKCNPEPE